MATYYDLKAELLGQAYTGKTDAEALELLTAPIHIVVDPPVKALRRYLVMTGKLGAIEIAAEGTDAVAAVCRTALAAIQPSSFDTLDFTIPEALASITAMLDVVMGAGIISQSDKTAILALGNTTTTRAAQIGWPQVTIHDIAYARRI